MNLEKKQGSGAGCRFPELQGLSKSIIEQLSPNSYTFYPIPLSSAEEGKAQRERSAGAEWRDLAGWVRVGGSGAASGLGYPLPSTLPEDQWGGSLAYLRRHLPAASIGREQVLLLPSHGPKEDNQARLHTAFSHVSHVEKPKVSLSSWPEKKCPAHQPIHENFILTGLNRSGEGREKFLRTALSNADSKMTAFSDKRGRDGRKEEERRQEGAP